MATAHYPALRSLYIHANTRIGKEKGREMSLKQSAKLLAGCLALAVIGTLAVPLAASAATVSAPPYHHVHKVHARGQIPVVLTPACEEDILTTLTTEVGLKILEGVVTFEVFAGAYTAPIQVVLIPIEFAFFLHDCFSLGNAPPGSTFPGSAIPVTGPLPFPLPGSGSSTPPSECTNPDGCVG